MGKFLIQGIASCDMPRMPTLMVPIILLLKVCGAYAIREAKDWKKENLDISHKEWLQFVQIGHLRNIETVHNFIVS
jgi:hypothetical protein